MGISPTRRSNGPSCEAAGFQPAESVQQDQSLSHRAACYSRGVEDGITSPSEAQPQSRRRDRRERRGPKPEAQRVELTLHDMGYEGRALGRADERVIFADSAIPGEKAVVELYRNRPDY